MSENTFNPNPQDGKPVNINISFNISRKQVTQNLNPFNQQRTFNLKNNLIDDDSSTNLKSKNPSFKHPKTVQLAQTDRHIYSKQLDFVRPTQQMKRKKKRKKSSGDYTADKTSHFPFYPNQLDKSIPTHKRGYTTTVLTKKALNSTNIKSKKQSSSKADQSLRQNREKLIVQFGKSQQKPASSMQKSLKTMINKLINNQLSKRSLPLPSVPNKSKYNNQSVSLTSRKLNSSKTATKKRSSKSYMLTNKQKQRTHVQIQPKRHSSDPVDDNGLNRALLLQKLSNFKSVQNSLLISQVDKMQQKQDINLINQQRKKQKNRTKIVIKTDQSIQCMDQIHNYQKNKYKDQFFDNNDNTNNNHSMNQQLRKASQTQYLIQTYIKLLNQSQDQIRSQKQIQSHYENRNSYRNRDIPQHINQRVEVMEDGENCLNQSDFQKVQEMLYSSKRQREGHGYENYGSKSPIEYIQQLQNQQYQQSLSQKDSQKSLQFQENLNLNHQTKNASKSQVNKIQENNSNNQKLKIPQQDIHQKSFQVTQNKHNISLSDRKVQSDIRMQNDDTTNFKPFISSQMGRQIPRTKQQQQNYISPQQRLKYNEIKKQQIQKWGYLLDYIRSNMNSEANTQQVLQQVYRYLEQAKIDLLQKHQNHQSPSANKKQRLEEQFTNKLSSQISVNRDDEKEKQDFSNKKQPKSITKARQIIRYHQYEVEGSNQYQPSYQNNLQNNFIDQEDEYIDQQVKSFKSDYESQTEDIKYMNLQTIQSALKNRFKTLNQKKQKQLQRLQDSFDQRKLTQQQYQQQKVSIQKWFKHQTNQILSVKKNIWKGYNEAKSILDKSYINSRFEEQYKNKLRDRSDQKRNGDSSSTEKKNRTMMKCLSQSYLNKKKVDYKKFIEQEQKKRQQENQQQQSNSRLDDQDELSSQQQQDQDNQEEQQDNEQQNDQNSAAATQQYHKTFLSSQQSDQIYKNNNKLQQDSISKSKSDNQGDNSNRLSQSANTQEQIQKINQKLYKLKQQHLESLALSQKHKPITLDEEDDDQEKGSENQLSQSGQKRSLQQNGQNSINQFNLGEQNEKKLLQLKQSFNNSRQKNVCSPQSHPLSPTSIHYEELQKDLPCQTDSDYNQQQGSSQYNDQQDYINDDYDQKYNQQQENIINQQLSCRPRSGRKPQSQQKKLKKLSKLSTEQQQIYSDYQQKEQLNIYNDIKNKKQLQKSMNSKLKYLTEQDKEDIFQFLFLDLCIQLYHQPSHNNKLLNSVWAYVQKQYQLAKRKKGVKTNLNVVKDYLKRFCGYIARTNKKTLENLNVPMGPTAIEMLKYMHENDDLQDEPIDDGENVVTLIVPVSIFDTFERSLLPTLEFEKYYDSEEKQTQRVNFLKNILHIHNKALFDALNEFLDQQRPFGIWGKPFPWKKSSSFAHKFNQVQSEEKLKKSAQKVVEACSYVCGLLIDKQQSLIGNSKVSQAYVQQIRQDRMTRMLANDMIQNEDRWVFYDDEQTEVLVETSNYIYNRILRQCIQELVFLKNRDIQQ